jgi:hypothetical protein
MLAKNRHSIGDFVIYHKGAVTHTPVGTEGYDLLTANIDKVFNYEVGYIPAGAAHRPDLISNVFFSTPSYWWLIMLVNNVSDPFEGLNVGDQILIPII